jgi:pimeloyl-ACP methyl ester carboxylesterase
MPDLPGHGLSDRPDATYDLDWYALVMEGWLEAAGVARADVVGHSFGGGVAQMMLRRCPERIRRVVLVSSGGLGREVTMALRLASIPRVVEPASLLPRTLRRAWRLAADGGLLG